jgi:hypothetical protein
MPGRGSASPLPFRRFGSFIETQIQSRMDFSEGQVLYVQ